MSNSIWKYPLTSARMNLSLPEGSQFRHAAYQHGNPTLWFEVDPAQPPVTRTFRAFATGQVIEEPESYIYRGTIHTPTGLVWHIYEEEWVC